MADPLQYDGAALTLTGELTIATLPAVEAAALDILRRHTAATLRLNLAGLTRLDTAGAVFLQRLDEQAAAAGIALEPSALPDDLERFRRFVARPSTTPAPQNLPRFLERLGDRTLATLLRADHFFFLMSDLTWGSVTALFDRKGMRQGTFIDECLAVGYRSLPIIALILFLIGAVSALQSAAQLRRFGAHILVADLLAIGIFKELGPLMTAIIVSGRSGSAMAAEIGTMKFNEELDALRTMGVDPLRFVAVPKMWAMLVCVPLLTVVANFVGVLGGVFVSITSLQVPPLAFVERAAEAVVLRDMITGLVKSVSFAWAITLIAVYFGLNAGGGPSGVGRATTASVVAALFGIIFLDSLWGLLFHL